MVIHVCDEAKKCELSVSAASLVPNLLTKEWAGGGKVVTMATLMHCKRDFCR